ncbi:MAG TPA: M14 metallopeptidase family protein [Gemmatimonadaceae bacterium]
MRLGRLLALPLLLVPALLGAQSAVPTPSAVIGFEPGTDRRLPSWTQVVEYFSRVDAASPRLTLRTLGRTTKGRPFVAAFIADSATLADLPRFRDIQTRLADARLRRGNAAARERLVAEGKTIVLVTSSIHSTEVGGIMTPLVLADRLVRGEDEETRAIRAGTITILVPSLNPDGVDIVGDWYRATVGTPAEGTSPPQLYHHYVGHDNNRDWYAFTQVETQLTIDSLHNAWHPQIVNDIHQQGASGSRIFIPPYMDPIEPNVDPIVTAGVNAMGMAMAWRLTADGKTGIAVNASYDAWTPARAYQHYHGGIRILTETASARLASPIELPFDSLRPNRGYDSKVSSWNFLAPWPGGRWTVGDIVDYQTSATWALLAEAARDRRQWLESFATVAERAVAGREAPGRGDWPVAFAIPAAQRDTAALHALLRILQRGGVEVHRAAGAFASGSARHGAGTYVVPLAQPYGAFAKALLERQRYPDLREYPGGPPKRPYDVTAHTLPLLMGVEVAEVREPIDVALGAPIPMVAAPTLAAAGLSGRSARRIGLYASWAPSMDEGWTRWIFDQYRIPYTTVRDRDLRTGGLARRFDVIVLPDQSPRALERGAMQSGYPDSLRGGIGTEGAAALRRFVEDGGTLVAFNEASRYVVDALELPVRDVLEDVGSRDFYAPGSLLRVETTPRHPLAGRLPATPAIWFEDGPAFEVTDPSRATIVARYPEAGDPLVSGWLLGGDRLRGKGALVEARLGRGRVVLFGFRPQYRAQSMATYPLIWSALAGDGEPRSRR